MIKKIILALALLLALTACGGNPHPSPPPISTPISILGEEGPDDAAPAGRSPVKYNRKGVDAASIKTLESGALDEFIKKGEYVYLAASGDITGDGTADIALAIGLQTEFDNLVNYTNGSGRLSLRVFAAEGGSYALIAETDALARLSPIPKAGLLCTLAYGEKGLALKNFSNSMGFEFEEVFYFEYSRAEKKLFLAGRSFTKPDYGSGAMEVGFTEDVSALRLDVNGLKPPDLTVTEYSGRVETFPNGIYSIEAHFPSFGLIGDAAAAEKAVQAVREGFEAGAAELRWRGVKSDAEIYCEKVFQSGEYISFVFRSSYGECAMEYAVNLDARLFRPIKLSEIYTAGEIESLLPSDKRNYPAEALRAACAKADDLEALSGGLFVFSRFTAEGPAVFVFESEAAKPGEILARDADELLAAIGSDRTIRLTAGTYDLSARGIVLSGVENLKILGAEGGGTVLAGNPAGVGIKAFNTKGAVFSDIVIENFGCAVELTNSSDFEFTNLIFRNNKSAGAMFSFAGSRDIRFVNSLIQNNSSGSASFFSASGSSAIVFVNTSIANNTGTQTAKALEGISFVNAAASGNSFQIEFKYPPADAISDADLVMGIIGAGMPRAELDKTLAKAPDSDLSMGAGDAFAYDEVRHYTGVDVGLKDGAVRGISTGTSLLTTARGIKIGASVEDVYSRYGYADIFGGVLAYPYPGGGYEVYFVIRNEKVFRMGIRPD